MEEEATSQGMWVALETQNCKEAGPIQILQKGICRLANTLIMLSIMRLVSDF